MCREKSFLLSPFILAGEKSVEVICRSLQTSNM
jgi:hypothetical protein